ncbi:MAG TPA: hypothetical protein DCM32_07095 [Xanthomonadaceae bacterium]|jgi:uncharacterized membrane protein (DUF485 family)|nr:hypothetical protein [Xanthomonadaceae bacterium]
MSTQTPEKPSSGGDAFDETTVKRKLASAIKLLAIFCTAYFTAAVIATNEFAHIAGILVFGIPLAVIAGFLVFVVGIIVTRMCLAQDKGS